MLENRLIIVSNRLPFYFIQKKEELLIHPSSGGLVSSLKSYIENGYSNLNEKECDPYWVGSTDLNRKIFERNFDNSGCNVLGFNIHPVFIDEDVYSKHYNGFSNGLIWPLFHYFPSFSVFSEENYNANLEVNNAFAERILELYHPGDIIWIHDYHLMHLPGILRKELPDATIGFFLHIPFPSFELFRLLPNQWRLELLNGLLGADLIGFHTNDYVNHFLKSVHKISGQDHVMRVIATNDKFVKSDSFPISIDYDKFNLASKSNEVIKESARIKKAINNRKLIISVDRLDYTKGLLNRLEGFELFLESFTEYRSHVSYYILVVPSRDVINKYKEIKKLIEETISRINGKYGSMDWTPIIYQYRSITHNKLVSIYLSGDIALITPIRDGMNLVAKEYLASQADSNAVLILSETAGAASELGEAIIVNPTDRKEISLAIKQAMEMPLSEQSLRLSTMKSRIKEYNVVNWAKDFIATLNNLKETQKRRSCSLLSEDAKNKLLSDFRNAKKRLILLDYDGTIVPHFPRPDLAFPDEKLIYLINELARNPANTLAIVSGRNHVDLEKWFGNLNIILNAEHGFYNKNRFKDWEIVSTIDSEWKKHVLPVLNKYCNKCHNSFVEDKSVTVAWHYRNVESDLGFLRSRELISELEDAILHFNLQIIDGNRVIEIRPRGINKGTAIANLLNQQQYDFVMAVGDDQTDEDMFLSVPEGSYSIKVGLQASAAKYNLKSSKEVLLLLVEMAL